MRFKRINGIDVPVAEPLVPGESDGYIFTVDENGKVGRIARKANTRMYEAGDILGKLVSGATGYHISAMYIEYQNNPVGAVPIPSVTRDQGRDYYAGLGAGGHDFLRVAMITSPLLEASDANYVWNQVTFYAMSTGTSGMNGVAFSAASNSTVFGAALVAAPNWSDWTEDLVYSRWYYSGSDQVLKTAGQQIGITRTVNFE